MLYQTTCVRLRYGCPEDMLSGFSRRHGYPRYRRPPQGEAYCQVRIGGRTCLPPSAPTPFNRPFRRTAAVSLPRPRVAPPGSDGILTVSAIGVAMRLALGPDLP